MKILAVYNMKGGVGKTTLCVNLSYIAANRGYRTLLVDLDPQGAASFYFRVRPSKKFGSKQLLGGGKKLYEAIKESDYENLDIIPASMSFRNLDIKLDSNKGGIKQLGKILKQYKNEYDIIFIDSPPNASLISENIIAASDKIIVPVIPTPLSHQALNKMDEFFKKKNIKPDKINKIFSMVEGRKRIHKEVMNTLRSDNDSFLKTIIPYRSEFEVMGLKRQPLPAYSGSSYLSKRLCEVFDELFPVRYRQYRD